MNSNPPKIEHLTILYEDEAIAIVYKPNGLITVPYPGSHTRTAINVLENLLRKKGTYSSSHKPFVVHRLDRDTSGVMMFAMTERAQKKIMDSWQTMVTERLYRAVAENPKDKSNYLQESGTIDDKLAYNAHNVGFVPKKDTYKTITARTHYKILEQGKYHTLFELSLDTGRKNQIRAHLASKGYPIAGDENYRAKTDPFGRLALHAVTLEFIHPYTNKKMKFEVPEPEEWLVTVKNNSGNIPTFWAQQTKKSKNKETEQIRHKTKKQMANMDFIQKGKLHR